MLCRCAHEGSPDSQVMNHIPHDIFVGMGMFHILRKNHAGPVSTVVFWISQETFVERGFVVNPL
ncbi:uncharacterized protein N7479_006935 [Penicillium vulpinum]|uniref:uncharacterized protein n=1 Tax=Penicillium vulpinum TaxID=29845 RepID=UPI0025486940|nr:uncharacterized protein N7479_006935 [Penicillium vulpinum]KAJ5959785.1 hypothetical protein N7479_006935 [Penicillium vulpinum]